MPGNEERPAAVTIHNLDGGRTLVELPLGYEGDVFLHCTQGTAHGFTLKQRGRPTNVNGEVDLTETAPGNKT